jgi:hypothetical protein
MRTGAHWVIGRDNNSAMTNYVAKSAAAGIKSRPSLAPALAGSSRMG